MHDPFSDLLEQKELLCKSIFMYHIECWIMWLQVHVQRRVMKKFLNMARGCLLEYLRRIPLHLFQIQRELRPYYKPKSCKNVNTDWTKHSHTHIHLQRLKKALCPKAEIFAFGLPFLLSYIGKGHIRLSFCVGIDPWINGFTESRSKFSDFTLDTYVYAERETDWECKFRSWVIFSLYFIMTINPWK